MDSKILLELVLQNAFKVHPGMIRLLLNTSIMLFVLSYSNLCPVEVCRLNAHVFIFLGFNVTISHIS